MAALLFRIRRAVSGRDTETAFFITRYFSCECISETNLPPRFSNRRPPKIATLFSRFRNGDLLTINTPPSHLAFDLSEATRHLSKRDECLKRLIAEMTPFQIDVADAQSPYEVLLESITYQSISGKAAATIFARIAALGENGRPPTPQAMLKIPARKLRKAGLSGAKVLAMKDLAKKAIEGIVPTHDEALKLSDEELVERL